MQGTKDPRSGESTASNKDVDISDRQADATSSETLSDIEETAKVSDATRGEKSGGGSSNTPSPDGAFDTERGGRAPDESAGPM